MLLGDRQTRGKVQHWTVELTLEALPTVRLSSTRYLPTDLEPLNVGLRQNSKVYR